MYHQLAYIKQLKTKVSKVGSKWESRHRVFNDSELKLLFDEMIDKRLNAIVKFPYYTGSRSGEIMALSRASVFLEYIVHMVKQVKES